MKRTLLEVFCGLVALVLMVSFHQQVARLEAQHQDVTALERKVEKAVAAVGDGKEIEQLRRTILEQTETRMQTLEHQLRSASAGTDQARSIATDLERAKHDVAAFRSQLSTDFERTKALVDAYISEVRAKEKDAAMKLSETNSAIATIASQLHRDPNELTRTMLLPTVQLNGDDTVGSGTIVFSGPNSHRGGKIETYALTSYHVVRNILADTPKAQHEGFEVTVYLPGDKLVVKGKMIAHQAKIDAALVQLFTDRTLPFVANVLPRNEAPAVKVWDPVCAVGCPLGNDPVPSHGEVSSLKNELNGANYWMINAPTYFGNSGGGIYRADTKQLIGVFSKIYTHGKGTPIVVPHMGLCTPIELVYEWLQNEKLDHLLQSASVPRVDLSQLAAPAK
ncbi:MAG: trypsin-like peptidase domain-containing protein [Planctomycetes bacterium]|jgi:S1-C subfamily serine protease|nr:trypsin-like peptidase domain-containing protein [Planctomycetota bacterium]